MDWTELEIFQGIDLNDSFVLNWKQVNDEVVFEIEASIWPNSIYYQKPKENEYTCYCKAVLKFVGIEKCEGLLNPAMAKQTKDPDGSTDYGDIEALSHTDNGFIIVGEFGSVNIVGGEIKLEIYA